MIPELTIFNLDLMGGGASFQRNLIKFLPKNKFKANTIYLYPKSWGASRSLETVLGDKDVIYEYDHFDYMKIGKDLKEYISNEPGLVVATLREELTSLACYPKRNKTVYFICHDAWCIDLGVAFIPIIDVFIAHNIEVYRKLSAVPGIHPSKLFYIPHGVMQVNYVKQHDVEKPLQLAFLARHIVQKGIYDLLVIDDILQKNNIHVCWNIYGDGPERENFSEQVKHKKNFTLTILPDSNSVIEALKLNDLYILPSLVDGLPVSMLEAMSVGVVPIVYQFCMGIEEVLKQELGTIIPVQETEKMATAIMMYNKDRDLLHQKSANCIREIGLNYNLERQAAKYYDVYARWNELKSKKYYNWFQFKYYLKRSKTYVHSVDLMKRAAKKVIRSVYK